MNSATTASGPSPADVPGNAGTNETVAVGARISGVLEIQGDTDWYAVTLEAGRTYVFEMLGETDGEGTLKDPLLSLYDANGRKLAEDDDNGRETNARLTFTATATGQYFIAASAWENRFTGSYVLTLAQEAVHAPDGPGIAAATVPTDPQFASQWHLQTGPNGIDVLPVWADYTGRGVRVGIFDTGVDVGNADLDERVDLANSFLTRDGTPGGRPLRTEDNHGTAVAGTIAAERNGRDGVGVAYNSTLVVLYDSLSGDSGGTTANIATAFDNALGRIDVLNNSWGYGRNFADEADSAFIDNFRRSSFRSAAAALESLAREGRGGLGTVVVQSAGNSRAHGDDTNLHNFQNSRFIVTVAATDRNGRIASFSTPGSSILLSAPGAAILTSDRTGADGYAAGDTATLSGTSFSAPIVSGVVALMLEANPRLGYRDVQEILALSAKQTTHSAAAAFTTGARDWNGGGLRFSGDYGFGLVDAHAAVRLAETWTAQSTRLNEAVVATGGAPFLAIPDGDASGSGAGVATTLDLTGSIRIDRIEIDIDVTHPGIGDLVLELRSPSGSTVTLLSRPGVTGERPQGSRQSGISFTFGSTAFLGELSAGQWELRLRDESPGGSGRLNSWTLRAYGDTATTDTQHVFTDDYGALAAAEPARTRLNDTDGGSDTINAAAVSSAVLVDLSGGPSRIAGAELRIAADAFEQAIGGDGDDVLIAGAGGATLHGGRGNDALRGGAGFDRAVFAGNQSAYSIARATDGTLTLTGPSGTDTVSGVERLVFDDRVAIGTIPDWQANPAGVGIAAAPALRTVRQEAITPVTDPQRGLLTSKITVDGVDPGGMQATLRPGWRVGAVADIDGNGLPEVFFFGLDHGSAVGGFGATWELGSSGAVVRTETHIRLRQQGWEVAGAADVNQRTGDEILWQHTVTGTKAIWSDTNRDGVLDLGHAIVGIDANPTERIVGTVDLDRDGRRDLVLFNDSTGRLTVHHLADRGDGTVASVARETFDSFAAFQGRLTTAGVTATLFPLPTF